ncbi:1,4-dihydroxy-2-naphthoate octaprenyltransferase [Crocinitomix catalasitica]|uniref:1,4-dihydroxy-2-naphthoate octaprenyltransferase n=1 Tax=Crocinitomix catalasitica TaxID=184607 RepID=UPI000484B648|nr:1,4-dihydroxy-2-naphthoate octaprenyltransferase [Crocinitomix catalasitica]
MKHWIKAFRLRTLPLSFSNILLGSGLAYLIGTTAITNGPNYSHQFSWSIFILTLITTLLLQILSNLANDYGDSKKGADNDGRIGPERSIQSGKISQKAMLTAIIIFSILSLISGILLLITAFGGVIDLKFMSFILVGLASIAAAIKYTVGKRAYGYSGLGDIFVFLFFGIVGVIGPFYLQNHQINWFLLLPATAMGCFSVAVLNLNNMRDQENDQKVGKITLAVKLGFEKSKIYHYTLFAVAYLAFILPLIIFSIRNDYRLMICCLPIILIHFIHLKKVRSIKDPRDFDPELKKVALSALLFSLLFFVTILYIL